jgi:hypothetical protein
MALAESKLVDLMFEKIIMEEEEKSDKTETAELNQINDNRHKPMHHLPKLPIYVSLIKLVLFFII